MTADQRHECRLAHAFCLHMARLDRSTRTLQAQWGNAADHSRAAFWLRLARAHRLALQEGDRGYGPDEDMAKDGVTEAAWVQEVKDRENRR